MHRSGKVAFPSGRSVHLLGGDWGSCWRYRITALMRSVVAGAGVNPADQRWRFWPLLPLGFQLQEQV